LSEPFQVATGGLPLTLTSLISSELDKFKKFGIKPVFVWNGLNLPRKEKPPIATDRATKRNKAWESYYNGDVVQASALFQSEKSIATNFINSIVKYFYEKKIESFRAPYYAWSQLHYFLVSSKPYPTPYVHAVLGGLEMLLFGTPTVITDIDFEKGTFSWVDLNQILDNLKMTQEQFLEACILAGFELCPTFPPIQEPNFKFKAAYDLVKASKSGYAAIQTSQNNAKVEKSNYLDQFNRTKAIIQHHPIIDNRCHVIPLNKDTAPRDLSEIVGAKFPDEVYFMMSQGIISPQVINNLVSGYLVEAPPLVDSNQYRQILPDLMDIRTKTLALLSSCLHPSFKQKKMVTIRWFDSSAEVDMDHAGQASKDVLKALKCKITEAEIKAEFERQKKAPTTWVDIGFIMKMQAAKPQTGGVILKTLESLPADDDDKDIVTTANELSSAILLQSLELREYLESGTRRPTPWGRALTLVDDRFVTEALCVLELIRVGMVNGQRLAVTLQADLPAYPNEREIALLTRVFTLLPMQLIEKSWEGPIDHDLMGFNSIVKALYKTIRNLMEMLMLNLFLNNRATLNPEDLLEVTYRLPFFEETNTALGLTLKSFFLESGVNMTERFPNCSHLKEDLRKGFEFWGQVMKMVEYLRKEKVISEDLLQEFQSATRFLDSRRGEVDTIN
jgi:hypothetical protein